MTPASAGKDTSAGATPASDDARHQLRQTHLYRLVDQYYLPFIENLLALERVSAAHVQRDPEDYLMFGRLGRLFRHLAIGGENRRQSGPRDNFGACDGGLLTDGRACAACRRQVSTPIWLG